MKTVSASVAIVAAVAGIASAAPSAMIWSRPGYPGYQPPTTYKPPKPECDLSCNNQGLKYAIYDNKNKAGQQNYNHFYEAGDNHQYSNFIPEDFKRCTPKAQGTTVKVGFSNANKPEQLFTFYEGPGAQPMRTDFVTINHVGYVFAQSDGEYTFKIPQADEITLLWTGDKAKNGWTRDNACLSNLYGANGGERSYKMNLTKGSYTPIRLMYANAQGEAKFQFSVTAPDGSVVVDANSNNVSKQLVQFSCDGKAMPFFPFGAEL